MSGTPTQPAEGVQLPPLSHDAQIDEEDGYFQTALREREDQLLAAISALQGEIHRHEATQKERDKAVSAREHTWKWVGSHYGKLEDWARKRLPEPWRNEFFSCIANGTWGHDDVGERYTCKAGFDVVPSGYIHMDDAKGQLVQDQMRRAEDEELRHEATKRELTSVIEGMQWKRVDQELPPNPAISEAITEYMVAYMNGNNGPHSGTAFWADERWWEEPFENDLDHLQIFAWMPLPAPPSHDPKGK